MTRWRGVIALVVCCGFSWGASGVCAVAGDTRAAPFARFATTTGSSATAQAAAEAEASALLGQLQLPAGAVESPAEPAGDEGFLAAPELGLGDTSNLADAHSWWIVPGTPQQVLAFVDEHRPPGAALFNQAPVNPGASTSGFALLRWPEGTGLLGERWLDVKVAQLSAGETGLRADGQVLWLSVPAPIPTGAKLLRVTTDRAGPREPRRERTVTRATRIGAVAALLNGLPVARPTLLVFSCPAEFGVVRLAFYASVGSPALATATIPIGGCAFIDVTVGGRQQPARSGSAVDVLRRIERDLGLNLDTRRAAPAGR
jgi:hypothetical protein